MARPTKINELLWLLGISKDGLTWSQLLKGIGSFVENGKVVREVICFPAPTLDRLLKKLIVKGVVEKTYVRSGKKGRPMGKYKLTRKYWEPDSLFGGTVPNMVRDEEGKLLLVRTVRVHKTPLPPFKKRKNVKNNGDYSERINGRKNIMRTYVLGDYIEKVSNVMGDRGIKINPYKERFSRAR